PCPIAADPGRPVVPREPRVPAGAGRRDRGENAAGPWIDLLDAVLDDLVQVPPVEGRSRMRGDVDRAQRLATRRIERDQLVSGGDPDLLPVIRDAVHVVTAWKGAILTDDLGV